MPTSKIYVIHSNSKIESLYTLFPLIVSKYSHLLRFVNIDAKEARTAEGECAILVRTFKGNEKFAHGDQKKRDYVKDFKRRFERVIMLDDGDGSDSLHFEYMDLVDLYYKGKLLKDKSHYLRPMYGRQIFSNYYSEKFGIVDEKVKIRERPSDPSVLHKLRLSWNLGYGLYPIPDRNFIRLARSATNISLAKALRPWFVYSHKKMIRRVSASISVGTRVKKVQARFEYKSFPNTIGYQRKTFMQKCADSKNVVAGNIKPARYNSEIRSIGAVLSPYGWGEVCFRDFEAIINGCLLIKPNMDHIETWPDVYKASETYVPVNWDGTDLVDTIDHIVNNLGDYVAVVEAAREEYRKSLQAIDSRVLNFLEEATAQKIS